MFLTVMSACAAANRRILVNIMNTEAYEAKQSMEKASGGVDGGGVRDVTGVEAEPTPAASSVGQLSRPIGEDPNKIDCLNGKTCTKSLIRGSGKFESGSGSGDQDGGQQEDGIDIAAKKRKTRRGKPKHRKLKPYLKQQLSYQQQLRYRSRGRLAKTGRQPPALYNTTQFLMDDHSDLPDLEQKLSEAASSEIPTTFQKPIAPPRTRDSSFSVDSDEDYFYSSPEDEEEFLTKEFSSAYEDLHAERLGTLTKSELIQEYIQLEAKVDLLTKRLRGKNFHQNEEREMESKNGGNATDSESAKKLKLCQQRIDDLLQQNEQLRRENETLRAQRHGSPVSSVDSESDSDSTSNGNRSRCSCPLSSPSSSPEHRGYSSSRREAAQRKENSVSSSSSDSSSNSSSPTGTPKSSTTPTNVSNGHVTIQEIDGLPT